MSQQSGTRIYIGGLPDFVGVEEISRHLSGYGKIIEAKIHSGYCFIQFENAKDASDVVDIFNRELFLGTKVTVEHARSARGWIRRQERRSTRVKIRPRYPVVISNMPLDICWQELKDFGRLAGGFVAFCNVEKPRNGRGFLEYTSQEDAQRAVESLTDRNLRGKKVKLYIPDGKGGRGPITCRRSRSRSPSGSHGSRATRRYFDPSLHATSNFEHLTDTYGKRGRSRDRYEFHDHSFASTATSSTEPFDDTDHYNPRDANVFAAQYIGSPPAIKNDFDYRYRYDCNYDDYSRRTQENDWQPYQSNFYHYNQSKWAHY